MDWLKGLNEAMKYIEENLEGAIDLDTAGKTSLLFVVLVSEDVLLFNRPSSFRVYPQAPYDKSRAGYPQR